MQPDNSMAQKKVDKHLKEQKLLIEQLKRKVLNLQDLPENKPQQKVQLI